MKKYALVTGASKGIGKSIAWLLAQKGYNLLLVARSEAELNALSVAITSAHQVEVHFYATDLSNPGAAAAIAAWFTGLSVPLSILVNNAGYGQWGNFDELPLPGQMAMMRVNIDAVVELSHYFIPFLKLQQQAYILNVSSTTAYQAVPTMAIYAAAKVFVLSFSRALRYELKNTPVSVSCLCPGPTDTNFVHRAGMDAIAELAAKFNMTPDDVAAIGIAGMFANKAEIVPGFLNKLSSTAARHSPKRLIERITAGLYKQ
ncbi:SDR family NAD(P)-dependent oxidoreductase [Mucilaginibacter ginsenosidivorax]|uniref:SDR family oxidoreductase n=1 Tax=Mucilaginibacter ginsenosidivorax TaxID=862126 RepID=A0A5B8W8H8_9SPHI|nr:SDR family oxidoreductase [Mucilaginibacter ginsenosidivorax]QEC79285.1 SDR family oxidoreductase [Mucilaginibacter ginsenosidivorax]